MASIVTKTIKGNDYLYLVESRRENGKVKQKTIKYIGKKRPIPQEEFECMLYSHENKDWILRAYEDTLPYTDHKLLKDASSQHKDYEKTLDSVSREKQEKKFLATFIANSNAIEGSTLTPKQTHDFLFSNTVPKNKQAKELHMATNLLKAWKYVEKNSQKLPTKQDLCNLHAIVNDGIEDDQTLGKLKPVQNYIGDIPTSSYLFVEEKLEKLLHWTGQAYAHMNEFEVSFQSHAQFEVIHPFVDGNGRVGRLLMNWLLLRKNRAPIAIPVKKRSEYISALENSRRGKLQAICVFCKRVYLKQYSFLTGHST